MMIYISCIYAAQKPQKSQSVIYITAVVANHAYLHGLFFVQANIAIRTNDLRGPLSAHPSTITSRNPCFLFLHSLVSAQCDPPHVYFFLQISTIPCSWPLLILLIGARDTRTRTHNRTNKLQSAFENSSNETRE